jgi:hypothetical protein
MTTLKVFKTAPAPVMAHWLAGILDKVIAAARLPSYPIEIRPTGHWSAWAAERESAPDGRLSISTKIAFWKAETIASVYLHESAHRLLEAQNVPSHGAEFLCLNAILLIRAADHFHRNPLEKLSLYDFADKPLELESSEFWQGEVLSWALKTAHELAATETPAIELAAVVCDRWQQHITVAQKARQKAVFAAQRQAEERQALKDAVSLVSLFRWLAALGWTSFLLVVSVFIFKT